MKKNITNFEYVLNILENAYKESDAPSVTLIANTTKKAFNVLLSTLISLRTKDEVTIKSSEKLFQYVKNFKDIQNMEESKIAELIYPAGFYKTKAKRMKEIADIVENELEGSIPDELDELLKLPGVGRKTANLVLVLGFDKPGLCVDTHVHRITNRFGWVKTKKPDDTEFALREYLPQRYWKIINDYLVSYGQTICRPISPHCSICKLKDICPKVSVTVSR